VEEEIPHTSQLHGTMLQTKMTFFLQETADNLSAFKETSSPPGALLKNLHCGLNHRDRYPTHSRHIGHSHDHEQLFPSLQQATS
jgi:hypothetical protein